MPYLLSRSGFRIIRRYVRNWYSILLLYANIIPATTALFKNGESTAITNFDRREFEERLYRRYLEDKGFVYESSGNNAIVNTPSGLKLVLLEYYSDVVDEIFVRKVYGELDLKSRTVIDIGAGIGDSSLYFIKLGASKVYGFENNNERNKLAQLNIDLNSMNQKVIIFNEEATSKTLRNFILGYELRNIFLKLDCEGCEYEIIENTDNLIFTKINDIVLEYHMKAEPLARKLSKLGFILNFKKSISMSEGILFATRSHV